MQNNNSELDYFGVLVADHISAMIAYWDTNLVCRFANAAYHDCFGKMPDEMIGKITLNELLGPLFEKNLVYINGALAGQQQTFEREITTPEGEKRYSLANYFPDIQNGIVQGFFVHVADITPTKALQKQIIRSNELIKEQNNRLLNFANIVSHNLKTYAYNLKEVLALFINAESADESATMLNYLKDISTGFGATVENLTEIAEAQNLGKLTPAMVNLSEYIECSISVLRIKIEELKVRIINNVSGDINILVNKAYLESILLNFLTNAIKYKHPHRDALVEYNAFVSDDQIILTVKDNGIGINLSKYGRDLFGLYKTFHGNNDAKGIGLFIAKFQSYGWPR